MPFIHIQDIEDYTDKEQRDKFYRLIDEIRKAEKDLHSEYRLGYSNYTFELWILLHVADMAAPVQRRDAYLAPINRYFSRNFVSLDDFKSEAEFQKILNEYITLDSVLMAIERAEWITERNKQQNKVKEEYKKSYFIMITLIPRCMKL